MPGMVDTPIYAVAQDLMDNAKAKGHSTPIGTILKAFESFLPPDNDITGQAVEASQEHVVIRDWTPYLNVRIL